MLSADHLWPHALLRVGHKGLFFDRLDVGVAGFADSAPVGGQPGTGASLEEPPRLVPFAQGFYHVRNRVYVPQFGRWLQRDPNASGLAVLDSLAYHGGTQAAAAMAVDMEQMYGDGMSLYAYLGGNPWTRSDPTGLNFALNVGMTVGEMANDLVSQYSLNLMDDVRWASDWSSDDDAHTRADNSWVSQLLADHLARAANESIWSMLGPVGMLRDLVQIADSAVEYIVHDGDVPQEYASSYAANAGFKSPVQSLLKHGKEKHQRLIGRLISKGRGRGANWFDVRVNRELINPHNGATISKLRPDYFAFKQPNTIILGEAAVSQSVAAARKKLGDMAALYRRHGFHVVKLPIETTP